MAYRGRILVEVTSDLDSTLPKMIKQNIDPAECVRRELDANFGGYNENYKLMAILLSANMVYPNDDLVEFEVSIGEFKLLISIPSILVPSILVSLYAYSSCHPHNILKVLMAIN